MINELDSTITTYRFDPEKGALKPVQVVTTLPTSYTGNNSGAEIAVAPSGRFLYGSNRGHDSIVIFAIDTATGGLTPVGWQSTQGRTPRFFALDPSGRPVRRQPEQRYGGDLPRRPDDRQADADRRDGCRSPARRRSSFGDAVTLRSSPRH